MSKLSGKIAVVTGGNSGIGLATAKLFAQEGANVVVTGRRKPEVDAAVAVPAPLDGVSEEHFDLHFDINVKGLLFTVQKALPLLSEGGAIVLNSSVVNTKGIAGFSVYSATKAAVRSFARTWTTELKDRKIRVNVVSPGPIETPIFDKMGLSEQQFQEFGAHISAQIPLGRFGRAEEIANAVLFLASNDSSYVAGVDLRVDGGMVAV
jgi:NAD(P)-dependent dehydrogenase (short-subunit alcohol dehydrogenase family)